MPSSTPLSSRRLGPYELIELIGKGGMGEVWRARDPRLGRDVAIKISAHQFSDRFEREARAIAALNHSNICTLFDVGPDYLVMELVDGPTLADRIKRGPIPLEEALNVAGQIADALDAAHEKGIVHRDLKPANIKLRPDGSVKVLDFGLAKSGEESPLTSDSPTMLSATGMILGTAGYMSPEQARGRPVDKRADIWAFGVVLYEMATGKHLFQGDTTSDILAAVLTFEPDFDLAPARLRPLLRGCLQKEPRQRLQAAGDWRLLTEFPPEPTAQGLARRTLVPWALAAFFAMAAFGIGIIHVRKSAEPPVTNESGLTLSIVPPAGTNLSTVGGLSGDHISPDGSAVLYLASGGDWRIRRLNSLETQVLPHFNWTGDGFWSPDSKSVVFPTASGWMKLHLPDGAPEVIRQGPVMNRGGAWSEKGTILIAGANSADERISLYEVPPGGGKAFRVEIPGLGGGFPYDPVFLPGSEDFLFAFAHANAEGLQIYLATLSGTKAINPTLLFTNDTAAQYTPAGGGHILFVRNDNLYSQRLDLKARKLSGDPELVQPHVVSNPGSRNAAFSVSNSGTIVWRSGTAAVSQVTVFDRRGNRIGTAGDTLPINVIGLSPDEDHVLGTGESGAWVLESNGPGQARVSGSFGRFALWSRDGSHLITDKGRELVEIPINAAAEPRELADLPVNGPFLHIMDLSSDGRTVLYGDFTNGLSLFSLEEKQVVEQPVRQQADSAALSPDGTWIVYQPYAETAVYVQPLMGVGFRKQIGNSGNFPVWRRDGKEILYFERGGKIWSVRVEGSGLQLRFAPPEMLFDVGRPLGLNSGSRPLAVNHDGSRIYVLQSPEQPESNVIQVRTRAIR